MFLKPGSTTAFIWQDAKITYDQILQHVDFYSTLFDKNETGKVAIFSPNKPEWAYAFYAGWKNDSIVVPIDFMATAEEVAYILNDCRPEVVFISEETADVFNEVKEKLVYPIQTIILEKLEHNPEKFSVEPLPDADLQKTAVIIYTSGTTGSPKGVMLSYDNLLANIEAVVHDIHIYTPERRVMALLPLHHIFPLQGTLVGPLYAGGTIAFAPSMVSEDIIATLQNNQINIIIGVPRLYEAIRKGIMDKINANIIAKMLFKLARVINSRAFSKKIFKTVHQKFGGRVEYMVCGGAKLNEDVASDFKVLGFEMLEGFGMTEAAPMITFTRPGRWKIGSAGESMPELEVTTRDGEVIAKGRNIMQGYYNRPEETAQVLKDGWLHTGDLGYIDVDGYIHITGRRKEIIVLSNGKNINPEEIESKLMTISDCIAEVGVFMMNDSLQAAILPDFKVMRDKNVVNIDEMFRWDVIDQYNRKSSSYKKISKFVLVKDELPKTRLGKIQRFKLSELAAAHTAIKKEHKAEPDYEEYQVIRDFMREQTKAEVAPDDHFEIDLGLDSLDKISFITFLQSTFGVDVREDILLHHSTIEKIAEYMREKKSKIAVEAVKWSEIFKEKVDLKLPKSWFTQNLFKNLSKYGLKLYFRLKGEGTDNLPEGPFILAPNHQSFYDGLFVSAFLNNRVMKNTYFYAKEKHVRNRWVRAFANRHNVIIMDINRDLKHSLQKLAEVLKKGKNVMIFPEGTRTNDGQLGKFKKAFAILSHEMNVPIIPVSIKGAFEALPKGRLIPKPFKKINIKFHKPVFPTGHDYDTLLNAVFQQLNMEMA
ncbi:MAG: AMP-binding protein [Calditrichaceae bacterium]